MNHLSDLSVYLVAHPAVAAALSLVAALVANWALGSIDALVRGTFSLEAWPRIIRTQLASTYVVAIAAAYGAGLVAGVVGFYLRRSGLIDLELVRFVAGAVLTIAAAASALYSANLWNECRLQLLDIVAALTARRSGNPMTAKRNVPADVKAAAAAPAKGVAWNASSGTVVTSQVTLPTH